MIRIGTAGWTIPRLFADRFGAAGSHLERYARRFATAEINSSFHRPPRRETYARGAAAVPEDFRFAVKCPRTMTHDQRLIGCEALLDRFAEEVAGLGPKLGALLVQLPPSFAFTDAAEPFFALLRERIAVPPVFEPRHASWFTAEAGGVLDRLHVARVAADPPPIEGADSPGGWAGLAYYRLHGSPRIYRSPYGEERCGAIAARLGALEAAGTPAWCIFDNTTSYAATGDALHLQEIVQTLVRSC